MRVNVLLVTPFNKETEHLSPVSVFPSPEDSTTLIYFMHFL